ncbi:MAG: DAK2 domain-containing protein [Lachnospiraceae bacterium]|nr:DAK2 domain-containing protein [Lachnospiraceae bacterium]
MSATSIDAKMLSQMFLAGAKNLEANQEIINELNVFPVPDGDTGTNMTATIMQAASEVYAEPDAPMDVICKSISSGSLRGARGNSGVILSQLLRGFTKVVKKHDEITGPVLAEAFEKAVETAYKAVMKPKEGTILTVARGAGDRARELAASGETDIEVYFTEIIRAASETLETTPDLLPVLKEAGVVDSGGKGLLEVLKGAYDGYLGKGIPFEQKTGAGCDSQAEQVEEVKLKYAYCVVLRVILSQNLNRKQMMDIRGFLSSVGDDVKVNDTGKGVFLHIHTNDPGLVIQKSLLYGEICEITVSNIAMEGHIDAPEGTPITSESLKLCEESEAGASPLEKVPAEHKDTGFVAVCSGVGMAEIFKSLGCDIVIEGGQTMNPSTDDIIKSAERVNADKVFILPNNKNIILAAEQAGKMTGDDRIVVIPTKTVPQGISALVNYIPGESAEENESSMREAISTVASGEVTYAVRDVVIEGQSIKQGDYMGIGDSGILCVGNNRVDVTVGMLEKLMKSDSELISVYYGEDVDENEAAGLLDRINSKFSGAEVELQYGGQPIYDFIVSVE